MIVVKVGGSLYDHPRLGPGLREYLSGFESPVLLVPGGGAIADAVRQLDAIHHLGEEAAHWAAIRAMSAAGAALDAVARDPVRVAEPSWVRVLDAFRFAVEDEHRPDHLPHSWAVTSDSIALRAALVYEADHLILLKSVAIPAGTPWEVAAEHGWVDVHFPALAATAPFPIEAVDFRTQLGAQ